MPRRTRPLKSDSNGCERFTAQCLDELLGCPEGVVVRAAEHFGLPDHMAVDHADFARDLLHDPVTVSVGCETSPTTA
ncbi:MAG: hypothetical protein FWD59_05430 [Micrococcales bacterium]|nr:hypothetical protein [Micrococcales bacterium]